MRYQRLYDKMPIPVQHAMATLYGYKNRRIRFGAEYRRHLSFLHGFSSLPRATQEEYQRDQLHALLTFAATTSRFYRELYAGLDWEKVRTVEDLPRLPTVTKEALRADIQHVVTIDAARAITSQTGGTTGKSLEVRFTRDDYQKRMATLDYFKSLHGFDHLSMKRATFSGKHIVPPGSATDTYWRYNHAMRQMVYSTFHIAPDSIKLYLDSLERFAPHAIDGFVSSIHELATFVISSGRRSRWHPIAIFTTSETVTPEHREALRKAFGCELRDQYASSEGAPFVYECTAGRLHYDLSSGVIESDPNTGEILVTSFTTYGTPLIRYAIGDRMYLSDPKEECSCRLTTPLVRSIEGRGADALHATNGARVSLVNIANMFKKVSNSIVRGQVVQEAPSRILIRIVAAQEVRARVVAILTEEARHKFGEDMDISFSFVPEIDREASGKYRLVIDNTVTQRAR